MNWRSVLIIMSYGLGFTPLFLIGEELSELISFLLIILLWPPLFFITGFLFSRISLVDHQSWGILFVTVLWPVIPILAILNSLKLIDSGSPLWLMLSASSSLFVVLAAKCFEEGFSGRSIFKLFSYPAVYFLLTIAVYGLNIYLADKFPVPILFMLIISVLIRIIPNKDGDSYVL